MKHLRVRVGRSTIPLAAVVTACLMLGSSSPAPAWIYWPLTCSQKELSVSWAVLESVVIDGAGDVIAGGSNQRAFFVVKLAGDTGTELWSRAIRDVPDPSANMARAVAVDASGDVIAAGSLYRGRLHPRAYFFVAKFSGATGEELWEYTLPDSGQAHSVAVDNTGDAIVGGYGYVVKLSGTTGAELWRQTTLSETYSIRLDRGGDVIAAGQVYNPDTWRDFAVVKLSGATGDELWRYTIIGTGESKYEKASEVDLDPSENVIAAGVTTDDAGEYHSVVVKLSGASGAELWNVSLSHAKQVFSLVLDGAGDVVVLDRLEWWVAGSAVKLSGSTGAELWRQTFWVAQPAAVVVDKGENIAMVGPTGPHFSVAKLSGVTGETLWYQVIVDSGLPRAMAMALAENGDLIVAGNATIDQSDNPVVARVSPNTEVLSYPRAGKTLVVMDHAMKPSKRKIRAFIPGGSTCRPDGPLWIPNLHSLRAPIRGGAVLRIVNPNTAESATFTLPASHWRSRILRGSVRYEYRDPEATTGPCTKVTLSPHKGIRVSCLGRRGTIPFTLDEPFQGELAVALRLAPDEPSRTMEYCAWFGGTVVRDSGTGNPGPAGIFKAKNAEVRPTPCPSP